MKYYSDHKIEEVLVKLHHSRLYASFCDFSFDLTGEGKQDFMLKKEEFLLIHPKENENDYHNIIKEALNNDLYQKAICEKRMTFNNVEDIIFCDPNLKDKFYNHPKETLKKENIVDLCVLLFHQKQQSLLQADNCCLKDLIDHSIESEKEYENKMSELTKQFHGSQNDLKGDKKHLLLMKYEQLRDIIGHEYNKDPKGFFEGIPGSNLIYEEYVKYQKYTIVSEISHELFSKEMDSNHQIIHSKKEFDDLVESQLTTRLNVNQINVNYIKESPRFLLETVCSLWTDQRFNIILNLVKEGRVTAQGAFDVARNNVTALSAEKLLQLKQAEIFFYNLSEKLTPGTIVSFKGNDPVLTRVNGKIDNLIVGTIEFVENNTVLVVYANDKKYPVNVSQISFSNQKELENFNAFYNIVLEKYKTQVNNQNKNMDKPTVNHHLDIHPNQSISR